MHTDYQAVARQLEWLADGVPDTDTNQDLKALARNVRLLGVMAHVLSEARRRRRLREAAEQPSFIADPAAQAVPSPAPFHPCA